jgi:dihydrolipoamide dehydrogenase
MNDYNLIVIGAGPAGTAAAVRASQLGAKVLLIEKSSFGGTCLNWGCIPTKFLWEACNTVSKIKKSVSYAITAEMKEHSFALLIEKKNKNVELLSKGVRQLLASYNIELIEGSAAFSSAKTVEVKRSNGQTENYQAEKIIIAAGSVPSAIPGYQFDHIKFIDSTDALNLTELPKSLLVVGGGAIGVEFASIFSALGAQVHLVEKQNQLLPGEDSELAEEVKKGLLRQGIKVETGVSSFEEPAKTNDKILIATGRKSNTASLALEKTGVKYGPKGIEVNEFLETSVEGIFAAGDVDGRSFLAYTAHAEGVLAAENALGTKKAITYSTIPKAVFSVPPAASVGIVNGDKTEGMITGKFDLAANSRAFIEGERRGWVKITAEKSTGVITGGQILGAGAEELISIIALAVKQNISLHQMSREIFFHPSISEAIHSACEAALGKCVDLPRFKNRS